MDFDIKVSLSDSYFEDEDGNGQGYADKIITEAARQLIAKTKRDISGEVAAVVRAGIEKQVEGIVSETIKQGVAITNNYGEPTGKSVTLREVIVDQAKKWMEQKVNTRGEVDTYYGRDGAVSRVHWMITTAVAAVVGKELKAEIDSAIADLRGKLTGQATHLLAEGLNKLLGVKALS